MPDIIISVAGETPGDPGEALKYTYDKIEVTPPLVTLTIDDNSGITQWEWEILMQPADANATLSGETTNTATFTPTANVAGTYYIRCTFNGGAVYADNGVAWGTKFGNIRTPAPGETLIFSSTRGWDPAIKELVDIVDAGGPSDSIIVVSGRSDPLLNGKALITAYDQAKLLTPGGAALSDSNRAMVLLQPGEYDVGTETLTLDADFVDLASMSGSSVSGNAGSAVIQGSTNPTVEQTARNVRILDVGFYNVTSLQTCLVINNPTNYADQSYYSGLTFTGGAPDVFAVRSTLSGFDSRIDGTFEDCRTELPGFILGGWFGGIVRRCSGGQGSFAGWYPGSSQGNFSYWTGLGEDCDGGEYSFCSSGDTGASLSFTGQLRRCRADEDSFVSLTDGVSALMVVSGEMEDCHSSGDRSFCYGGGDAAYGATTIFRRCTSGDYSFVYGTAGGITTFDGIAEYCQGGEHCFGIDVGSGIGGGVGTTGILKDCVAKEDSFGGTRNFYGRAERCRSDGGNSFGAITSSNSPMLIDCISIGGTNPVALPGDGVAIGCKFSMVSGPAILLTGSLARIYNCDLLTDRNFSIDAAVAETASVAHCRARDPFGSNVTNAIITPYNVIDASYVW